MIATETRTGVPEGRSSLPSQLRRFLHHTSLLRGATVPWGNHCALAEHSRQVCSPKASHRDCECSFVQNVPSHVTVNERSA